MADIYSNTTAPSAAPNVFDPIPGNFHVLDMLAKNPIEGVCSDCVKGCVAWGINICLFTRSEMGGFIQSRVSTTARYGQPFHGPDGTVLSFNGVRFGGGNQSLPSSSGFTEKEIKSHSNYGEWISSALFAGQSMEDSIGFVVLKTKRSIAASIALDLIQAPINRPAARYSPVPQ